jgi:hypothetical protein
MSVQTASDDDARDRRDRSDGAQVGIEQERDAFEDAISRPTSSSWPMNSIGALAMGRGAEPANAVQEQRQVVRRAGGQRAMAPPSMPDRSRNQSSALPALTVPSVRETWLASLRARRSGLQGPGRHGALHEAPVPMLT